jgi:hypothetical protein
MKFYLRFTCVNTGSGDLKGDTSILTCFRGAVPNTDLRQLSMSVFLHLLLMLQRHRYPGSLEWQNDCERGTGNDFEGSASGLLTDICVII